jgi:hypothetical protein
VRPYLPRISLPLHRNQICFLQRKADANAKEGATLVAEVGQPEPFVFGGTEAEVGVNKHRFYATFDLHCGQNRLIQGLRQPPLTFFHLTEQPGCTVRQLILFTHKSTLPFNVLFIPLGSGINIDI